MNIQTEHLENRIARLTVEVDPNRVEAAKKAAARKIAKRINIPGFRRGKAPYNMIVRYVGEVALLEDAIEELGQEVYRESLEQADVHPYGPGQLEDFSLEPSPTFIYTVPLVPSTDLKDYREIRLDYEAPTVGDEDVDRELAALREEEALIEESQQPVAMGDRVTIDMHSYFVSEGDEEEADDTDAAETESEAVEAADADAENVEIAEDDDHDHDDHDHEDDFIHSHDDNENETYIHQHDLVVVHRDKEEMIAPGFFQHLVGAKVDDNLEFDITFPEGEGIREDLAGKTVHFMVTVKKIEAMTLPALNDDFAARFTDRFGDQPQAVEGEDAPEVQPLSLLELRIKMREALEKQVKVNAERAYAERVLESMVEMAEIEYPEMMVEDQLDDMLESLDGRLRQQGITLDMFKQVTGQTDEDIRREYRPQTIESLRRMLVLTEFIRAEQLRVNDEDYEKHMVALAERFSMPLETIKQTFSNPSIYQSTVNQILEEKAYDRLFALGRGEAPALPEITDEETEDTTQDSQPTEVDSAAEVTPEETPEDVSPDAAESADDKA